MRDWTDVPIGAHACCRFDSAQQRQRVVAQYVAAGLARQERVAVFSRRAAAPALDPTDSAMAPALESGQLLLGVAEDAYFQGGAFDGATRVREFAALALEAMSAGFTALRVYADNGDMPAALSSPELWLEYEMRVAATIPKFPLIGLCGFSVDDPAALPVDLLDAVHDYNLAETPRPSAFHLRGRSDGSFDLVGELQSRDLDSFRRLMTAAAPVLAGNLLSLREVDFVDAAAALELHRLAQSNAVTLWAIPPIVRSTWLELGVTTATSADQPARPPYLPPTPRG